MSLSRLRLAALLTAFYTARQITLVFLGEPRSKAAEHAGEIKPVMTLPLVILAFFAISCRLDRDPASFPAFGQFSARLAADAFSARCCLAKLRLKAHSSIPLIHLTGGLAGRVVDWVGWCTEDIKDAHQKDPLESGLGPVFHASSRTNIGWMNFMNRFSFDLRLWFAEKVSYQFMDHTDN